MLIVQDARVVLPSMFTDTSDSFGIRTNILQLSITHASILHLFIMGALISTRGAIAMTPGDPDSFEMFRARAEIVKYVGLAIMDPVEACKDVNIFAVSALAAKGPFQVFTIPIKRPNQGPLRSLQNLESFGVTETVPLHLNGLSKIIRLKGSLERIQMPGLAAMISL